MRRPLLLLAALALFVLSAGCREGAAKPPQATPLPRRQPVVTPIPPSGPGGRQTPRPLLPE